MKITEALDIIKVCAYGQHMIENHPRLDEATELLYSLEITPISATDMWCEWVSVAPNVKAEVKGSKWVGDTPLYFTGRYTSC